MRWLTLRQTITLFVSILIILVILQTSRTVTTTTTTTTGAPVTEATSVTQKTSVVNSWPTFKKTNFYGDRNLLDHEHIFIPRTDKVNRLDFSFVIPGDGVCDEIDPTLLVMVLSMVSMVNQRLAIRETWGTLANGEQWPGDVRKETMKVIFVFGNTYKKADLNVLKREADEYGDIVMADFHESYYNLTYKVLMGYKWVKTFCPHAKFVMKVDEDTFFNVPYIFRLIRAGDWNNTIYGNFVYDEKVLRLKKSKFYIDTTLYSARVYPPHVKGNLYFMPTDLAFKLLKVAEYMPYFSIEDVYITGILAKVYDARHQAIKKNVYNINKAAKACDLALGKKFISQQIYDNFFYLIWDRVKQKELCSHMKYF